MAKHGKKPAPTSLNWQAVENVPDAFHLGTVASYWRKKGLWWAMRKVGSGAESKTETKKFRGPAPAKAWAEEFALEAAKKKLELREQRLAAKQAVKDAAAEARKRLTWGRMPLGERQLGVDQVWAMKSQARCENQILVVEIRKTTVLVLTRRGEEPWDPTKRDVRVIEAVTRLYRFVGMKGERLLQPGEELPPVPVPALEPIPAVVSKRGRARRDAAAPTDEAPWLF